MTSLKSH